MIQPLENRILFKKIEAGNITKSGIVLTVDPEAGLPSYRGKVLEIGPEVKHIKKSDEIIYGQFAPIEVKTDKGDKLQIISEDDVIAINKGE